MLSRLGLGLSLLRTNILRSLGLGLGGLSAIVLADGLDNSLLLLGLDDGDSIREGLLGTGLALGVGTAHDLDLDTQDTLTEQDVAGGAVDEVLGGLAGVDHEAVGELHGFGAGGAELAGDDDLAALGAALHDEAEDTVAGAADGEAVEELIAEGLALGDGGETSVLDLGGVEGDGVLGELEALLDEGGELADAATLLAEDLLGVGGADDDVGDGRGDADLDAGVALLSELALEEFVELGVEDTVSDELSPLGAVGRGKVSNNCLSISPRLEFPPRYFFPPMPSLRWWWGFWNAFVRTSILLGSLYSHLSTGVSHVVWFLSVGRWNWLRTWDGLGVQSRGWVIIAMHAVLAYRVSSLNFSMWVEP